MKIKVLIFSILLIGCNQVDPNKSIIPKATEFPAGKETSQEKTIINLNHEIVKLLKDRKYQKLSAYIHPEKGIRFSMYSFVSDNDKSFPKSNFEKYIDSDENLHSGRKMVAVQFTSFQ